MPLFQKSPLHLRNILRCINFVLSVDQLKGKMANGRRDCPGPASGSINMMLYVHILSISLPLGHFWTTTMGINNSNDTSKGSTGQERGEVSWLIQKYIQARSTVINKGTQRYTQVQLNCR